MNKYIIVLFWLFVLTGCSQEKDKSFEPLEVQVAEVEMEGFGHFVVD